MLHRNLIDGEWVNGEAIANINPSNTHEVVGEYARGTARDVQDAVSAARIAFGRWSVSSPIERHAVLSCVAREIAARRDELGLLLAREEGKILAEATAEVVRASQTFDFFAGEALRQAGETVASIRPGVDIEIVREPVGVVGVISPWNFPIAIPAWKIAPAICHGNTVVFKPAENAPGSAWALVEILNRSGIPKGVVNLVMGQGSIVGQALLESDLDAITFTGSEATGRLVAVASAARMRRVQLEMGGKNPLVVLDDADLDNAVECALNGAFYSTGQRCTASSRLIIVNAIHDAFVEKLTERLRRLRVDNALKPTTDIGPVVDAKQLEIDESYIEIGCKEGGKLIGGERVTRETPGFYLRPALFIDTSPDMTINRQEIFGPIAAVIRVENYDEALEVANDIPFGLSAGICTTNLKFATHYKRNVAAGMVMVNVPTAGVDFHVPFGGRKCSSYGPREQGRQAVEFFTVGKTSYTRY